MIIHVFNKPEPQSQIGNAARVSQMIGCLIQQALDSVFIASIGKFESNTEQIGIEQIRELGL